MYYTHILPLRGSFISVEKFGEDINELAKSYYSNRARAMTAQEITKVGFAPNANNIKHILVTAECSISQISMQKFAPPSAGGAR